jgi:iron(III) transport system permease protein
MLRRIFFSFLPSTLLLLLVFLLTLPVVAVLLSWLQFDGEAASILQQMLQTVLPDYVLTSLLLCLFVAFGRSRHGDCQRGHAVRVSGPAHL